MARGTDVIEATEEVGREVLAVLTARIAELEAFIHTVREMAEERADVSDDKPNLWMRLYMDADALLRKGGRL
jgi:hypothetical protein